MSCLDFLRRHLTRTALPCALAVASVMPLALAAPAAIAQEAPALIVDDAATANPDCGTPDIALLREGQCLIAQCDPLWEPAAMVSLAQKKAIVFALELVPRITRAQTMDVLSSMATIAGYKAVLLAASESTRFFPMLTTAAGTVKPATVLVLGVGVAGLQALATAKRLGGRTTGYDVRPEVADQVRSVGAQWLDLGIDAAGEGGYARELTDEEKDKQQQALEGATAQSGSPLREEFGLALREIRLGAPSERALGALAQRVDSEELVLFVAATEVARQVGGNLAGAYAAVGAALRQRFRLEGKLRAMTAQGKLQGWLVGLLPLLLAGVVHRMRPDLVEPMLDHPFGWGLAATVVALEVAGWVWIRHLVALRF